jgi:hypothetical protein
MSTRHLRPDLHRQKVISLTRTERWLSAIRHHSDSNQRISALDLNDLAIECRNWPGSVAVVEVDEVNLAACCRFAAEHRHSFTRCALFAVTDFSSIEILNALAVAGYQWTCRSPLAAKRLFRQIQRHHDLNPLESLDIESSFGQRLPWKAVARYAGGSFKTTRFSVPPTKLTQHSDSLTDAENSND